MVKKGFGVSGSDNKKTIDLQFLIEQGLQLFPNQSASNIPYICRGLNTSPVVVVSSAIPKSNPELKAAQSAQLKIWHRSDLLAWLMTEQISIAVAGSHGKTTTSTFISTLFAFCGEDPTAVIGGLVPHYASNGHAGQGKFLVAEADESDGSLVKFRPHLGVITNIELDHTNHYENINSLIRTIKTFSKGCKHVLANYDCSVLRKNLKAETWWSIENKNDAHFAALPSLMNEKQTIAKIYEKNQFIGEIDLPIAGKHNLSNAIAAIAACRIEGIPFKQLQAVINKLKTPGRRFEFRGTWQGRKIIDDYAHHPTEVTATLSMAKLIANSRTNLISNHKPKILAIFQPHRYTRTKEFLADFAAALTSADLVLLTPIYEAGETPIPGINSELLAKAINLLNPKMIVKVATNLEELKIYLSRYSDIGDLVLTIGAGDITNLWKILNQNNKQPKWEQNIAA